MWSSLPGTFTMKEAGCGGGWGGGWHGMFAKVEHEVGLLENGKWRVVWYCWPQMRFQKTGWFSPGISMLFINVRASEGGVKWTSETKRAGQHGCARHLTCLDADKEKTMFTPHQSFSEEYDEWRDEQGSWRSLQGCSCSNEPRNLSNNRREVRTKRLWQRVEKYKYIGEAGIKFGFLND